jgi:hypothetical protein
MLKAKQLTEKDVEIILTCSPENEQIEGNASAITPDVDRETVQWIKKELSDGNEWAWCTVTVIARIRVEVARPGRVTECVTLEGFDHLGCCSYRGEADFRTPGGYFDDMKAQALDDLQAKVNALAPAICEVL